MRRAQKEAEAREDRWVEEAAGPATVMAGQATNRPVVSLSPMREGRRSGAA